MLLGSGTVVGADVTSKVLDLEHGRDGSMTVVVTRQAGRVLSEETDVRLRWTSARGMMELPVAVAGGERDYGPVWLLSPAGRTVRSQRREHFRAPLAVPVQLAWPDEESGEDEPVAREGTALDLSEGGLLAYVPAEPPPADADVQVSIDLDGDTLTADAFVVRMSKRPDGGHTVALQFVDPAVHGDRVRKAVFEAERRRASGR